MNLYTHKFTAICPKDGAKISYTFLINHSEFIAVESIKEACIFHEPIYHEDIADKLKKELPGYHSLIAKHSGVEVVTIR